MTSATIETSELFNKWVKTTEAVLRSEIPKRGIGITEDLLNSLRSEVVQLADGYLEGRFSFLTRGRFVDMGAGRGRGKDDRGTSPSRGRKAKRWYSPAMYGRLNDLEGVVGVTIMEMVIEKVIVPLKTV